MSKQTKLLNPDVIKAALGAESLNDVEVKVSVVNNAKIYIEDVNDVLTHLKAEGIVIEAGSKIKFTEKEGEVFVEVVAKPKTAKTKAAGGSDHMTDAMRKL